MSTKRKYIYILFAVLFFCLFVYCVLTLVYFLLPGYVENRLLKGITRETGLSNVSADVRSAGLHSLDLASIRIGDERNPAILVDSARFEYSPGGLYRGRIEEAVLSGLAFHCLYENGMLVVRGLDINDLIARWERGRAASASPEVSIGRLALRNALLVCLWEGKEFRVPFELDMTPEDGAWNVLHCGARLYPLGQTVAVNADFDLEKKGLHLTFDAEKVSLERFSDFTGAVPELMIRGLADLAGEADFRMAPFEVSKALVRCELVRGRVVHPRFTLETAKNAEKEPLPFRLEITRGDGDEWLVHGTEMALVSPVALKLSDLSFGLIFRKDDLQGRGEVSILMDAETASYLPFVDRLPSMHRRAAFSLRKAGTWAWDFKLLEGTPGPSIPGDQPVEASIGAVTLAADALNLELSGKGRGTAGGASYRLRMPDMSLSTPSERIQARTVDIQGKSSLDFSGEIFKGNTDFSLSLKDMAAVSGSRNVSAAESALKGRADLELAEGQWREGLNYTLEASGIHVSDGDISGKIAGLAGKGQWHVRPSKEALTTDSDVTLRFSDAEIRGASGILALSGFSLTADFQNAADQGFSGKGEIEVSGLSFEDLERQIKAGGINGRLPLQWPADQIISEGRWTVETIQWKGHDTGSFQGNARQNASGLIMEGSFTSRLLPGFSLDLSVETGFSPTGGTGAAVRFRSDPYALPEGMDLGLLLPNAGGLLLDGELAIDGELSLGGTGRSGWMDARLTKASLRYPVADISIEDIELDLAFKDLFGMRSAPKQRITFKKASLGELVIDGGEIEFQMESPGSLLIEKSRFQWCGGKIETQAMRIAPGIHDYDLLLYCDRLDFAKILNQFGASSATGTGTLNGRIPVRFREGGMAIQDGFLFSTPGEGGKISLSGSDFFTALIPTETLRISHIEIAREALKDYEYNWAKLSMTMEGDDLLLKLQLDGKPAGPLPFIYKQDQGKFIKIDGAGRGSIFQGIGLDINFRLPADRILYYGDIMRKIFKLKE